MNMIQHWLGIDVILAHLTDIRELRIRDRAAIDGNNAKVRSIETQVTATNRGLGRLIAKLDPHYATDELDASRKAESDRIGAEVMKKLIGEHLASKEPQ